MYWFFFFFFTEKWNLNQDAGYSLDKATNELIQLYPKYEYYIKIYYGRWEEMLGGEIQKSVQVLNKLIPQFKVFALTNWSAETFPVALKKFTFLFFILLHQSMFTKEKGIMPFKKNCV